MVYIIYIKQGDRTMIKTIGNYTMQVTEHHGEWMARVVYTNGGAFGGNVYFMKTYATMASAIKAGEKQLAKYAL
jgi:hypothetical protein